MIKIIICSFISFYKIVYENKTKIKNEKKKNVRYVRFVFFVCAIYFVDFVVVVVVIVPLTNQKEAEK